MSDVVYIRGLEVESLIGVYDFERHAPQRLVLDIEINFDCRPAGETDDLALALDYDRLSKALRAWCLEQSFELIESLAEGICRLIHEMFAVQRVLLTVNKPGAVSDCQGVGIRIERQFQ